MEKIKLRQALSAIVALKSLDKALKWPPDAFAICCFLLKLTGNYALVVHPPRGRRPISSSFYKNLGLQWRKNLNRKSKSTTIPKKLISLHANLKKHLSYHVDTLKGDDAFSECLLDLLAIADSACDDVGFPASRIHAEDQFYWTCAQTLEKKSQTLTMYLREGFSVLPKSHTPQVGITLRSLSYNLAFLENSEVSAYWYGIRSRLVEGQNNSPAFINLLLVPYPFQIDRSNFKQDKDRICGRHTLPNNYGFFCYDGQMVEDSFFDKFKNVILKARNNNRPINGVVLPEAALIRFEDFERLLTILHNVFPEAFLLSGVSGKDNQGGFSNNKLLYAVPQSKNEFVLFEQRKHHRWKLDPQQIRHYNLPLDDGKFWWENIDVVKRELNFFTSSDGLSFCFLICEDLARQEPIAPIVRSVAPHLIIALLQDGPQILKRWSARYASILAEDPGSSVLSLSSVGMIKLCKKVKAPYNFALWKDSKEVKEISLPKGSIAGILELRIRYNEQYTADGRTKDTAKGLFYSNFYTL